MSKIREQVEAVRTLWPMLLAFGGVLVTVFTIAINVYVGDLAMATLKSDSAKQYLSTVIEAQLLAAGVAKTGKITEMSGDIGRNKSEIQDVKTDIVRVESKAERIAQILMETD